MAHQRPLKGRDMSAGPGGSLDGNRNMRALIFHAQVEEIYDDLPPDTDLRSEAFFRAVMERLITRGALDVETDGVDVAVYGETAE